MTTQWKRRRSTTTPAESAIIVVGLLLVLNVIAFWGIWQEDIRPWFFGGFR